MVFARYGWRCLWIVPFCSFLAGYYTLSYFYRIAIVETPALVGKNVLEALALLSQIPLNPRLLAEKEDEELPAGTIISQIPCPRQKIKQHQSVFLVVSKKALRPLAPSLLGKPLATLEKQLKQQGIQHKNYAVPSSYPLGVCCAQHPEPQQPLPTNTIIIYRSAGIQKPVIMPDCRKRSVHEVRAACETYACTIDTIHADEIGAGHVCEECLVIDQRPLPGSLVVLVPEKPLRIQLKVRHHSAAFSYS